MKNNTLSIKSYTRLELAFINGLMDKQTLLFNNIDISLNPNPYSYSYMVKLEYLFNNPKDVYHSDVMNMQRYVSMFDELFKAYDNSPSLEMRRYKAHSKIQLLNVSYTLHGVFPREFKINDGSAELLLHVDHVAGE